MIYFLCDPPSFPKPNHPPPDSVHPDTIDPPSIVEPDPLHILELDRVALVSAILDLTSVSIAMEPAPAILVRRFTWVRETPHHLQDYHVFSTIMYLGSSYHEASTNSLWQQAMHEEFQALEKDSHLGLHEVTTWQTTYWL